MCYQIVELYASCRCLHFVHSIDPCAQYGVYGHSVNQKTVLVGYACSNHTDYPVDMLKEVNGTKRESENDRLESRGGSTGLEESQPVQNEDLQQVDTRSRTSDVGHEREWGQFSRSTPVSGSKAEVFLGLNEAGGARAAGEKISDAHTVPERKVKMGVIEQHSEKSLEQYHAKQEKSRTSEQYDMEFMDSKRKLLKVEEEIEGQNERDELVRTFLRNMENCLTFPGELDEGAYPSATRQSLELRLAVLEIWPSHIRGDYSFDAKIRQALSHVGLCDMPLLPGLCRLRWRCRCGAELFDDYMIPSSEIINEATEKRKMALQGEVLRTAVMTDTIWQALDGFEEMIGKSWLRGVSVVTRSSPPIRSSVGNIFKGIYYGAWRMIQELSRDLQRWKTEPELPSHRGPTVHTAPTQPPASSQNIPVHLLTCLPEQRLGTILHQKQISNLEFDKDLFVLLKTIYEEHRGQLRSSFTMRKPTGIHFNEFSLLSSPYVDIHGHEKHCQGSCSCLPPEEKVTNAEYAYNPVPPKRWPPIGPNTLLHLMNSPSCIDEKQVWMLKQFPKKLQGELKASLDEEVIGWGIYFQEGLHWTKIWAAVLTIIILGSFLFGVMWSIFQNDVQGAFGIASWWVSLCTVILAWLAARDVGA